MKWTYQHKLNAFTLLSREMSHTYRREAVKLHLWYHRREGEYLFPWISVSISNIVNPLLFNTMQMTLESDMA